MGHHLPHAQPILEHYLRHLAGQLRLEPREFRVIVIVRVRVRVGVRVRDGWG